MKKKALIIGAAVIVFLILLGTLILNGNAGNVIYKDSVPDNKIYSLEGSDSVTLYLYHQYGYEMFIDSKTITGEAASVIKNLIQNMEETDEKEAQISDEEVDLEWKHGISLPVESGTMWVKIEEELYRIPADDSQICRIKTPLGEGVILDFTEECRHEVSDAWSHWPNDCWYGTYEDGVLTMSHSYAAETSVTATVKSISINNDVNSIRLELLSKIDQTKKIYWESGSGDNYGTIDSKEVTLEAGKKYTVDLEFEGLNYSAPYTYYLDIQVGRTHFDIKILVE